jgi:hypothetical protein
MAAGNYAASVSSHTISTKPVITPSIAGTITDITGTTAPSGVNGVDFWTLDPEGAVTTNGVSKAVGKATITTGGYLAIDTTGKTSSNHNINITSSNITIAAGTNRYLIKAATSTTSGTASATANAGTATITK